LIIAVGTILKQLETLQLTTVSLRSCLVI